MPGDPAQDRADGAVLTPLRRPRRRVSLSRALPVLDLVETAIDVTDGEGEILYTNPWFTSITGYTSEQARGGTPRLLKSGVQDAAFYRQLWRTVRSGARWHGEVVNQRADGTLYLDEMTITPVVDLDSDEVRFIAAKKDVSRWMTLLSFNSPVGLLHLDEDGRGLWATDLAASLLGVSAALGDGWRAAFAAPTVSTVRASCVDAVHEGAQQRVVATVDGRWLDLRVSPLPVPKGTRGRLGVAVSLSDVTDTVRAAAALADRERMVSAVLDSLPDPTAIVDAGGRVIGVNDGWRRYGSVNRDLAAADSGSLGQSYLEVCATATAGADPVAAADGASVGELLRQVLAGDRSIGEYESSRRCQSRGTGTSRGSARSTARNEAPSSPTWTSPGDAPRRPSSPTGPRTTR